MIHPFRDGGYGTWITLAVGFGAFVICLGIVGLVWLGKAPRWGVFAGAAGAFVVALGVFLLSCLFHHFEIARAYRDVSIYPLDPDVTQQILQAATREARWLWVFGVISAVPSATVGTALLLYGALRKRSAVSPAT